MAPTRPTTSSARPPEAGGNRGTILNAADEVAVAAFLDGRVAFPRIADTIAARSSAGGASDEPDLDAIAALDAEVRSALSAELGMAAGSA